MRALRVTVVCALLGVAGCSDGATNKTSSVDVRRVVRVDGIPAMRGVAPSLAAPHANR